MDEGSLRNPYKKVKKNVKTEKCEDNQSLEIWVEIALYASLTDKRSVVIENSNKKSPIGSILLNAWIGTRWNLTLRILSEKFKVRLSGQLGDAIS